LARHRYGPAMVDPHERLHLQRHRLLGPRVDQQLPWQHRRAVHVAADLDADLAQLVTDRGPRVPGGVLGEHRPEQLRADVGQPPLHAFRDDRRRIQRVLQKVLQIPAHVLAVVIGQREREVAHPDLRRAAVVKPDGDPVPAVRQHGLIQPQRDHQPPQYSLLSPDHVARNASTTQPDEPAHRPAEHAAAW